VFLAAETSWLPFALPLCWPFCWWLVAVLDCYSRRVLGFVCFRRQPSSEQVRRFLGQVVGKVGAAPKYLVTDQGKQFCDRRFANWCRRHDIRQRFGAVGKRGSIAVIESFWKRLKEDLRAAMFVPLLPRSFRREVHFVMSWYNDARPHTALGGATPNEVYYARRRACRRPRFEPRRAWPRAAPCAKPRVLVKGPAGRLARTVCGIPGQPTSSSLGEAFSSGLMLPARDQVAIKVRS
jgi:transposase InsO family protein